MNARNLATRSDLESYGQLIFAAAHGARFLAGHGQGVSDAVMSRGYAETRGASVPAAEYALGYHLGRFLLFAGVPAWRAPVSPANAAEMLQRFNASPEGRKFAAIYGAPVPQTEESNS